MAELDLGTLLTAFGAVIGWVFAVLQFFIGRRDRKKDDEKHERELKEERRKFQIQVERPDPAVDLSCEMLNAGKKQYLLSTICVNNLGKDDLEIDGAVFLIDRAENPAQEEINFHEMDTKEMYKLLELGAEMNLRKCQEELCKEIIHINPLKEYLEEYENTIGHNENLRCHRLTLMKEAGFYRVTVLFHPSHEDLDFIYSRSRILYVPP